MTIQLSLVIKSLNLGERKHLTSKTMNNGEIEQSHSSCAQKYYSLRGLYSVNGGEGQQVRNSLALKVRNHPQTCQGCLFVIAPYLCG